MENDNTEQADLPYFKIYPRDEIGDFFEHGLDYESYGVFCFLRNKIWRKNIEFDAIKIAKNLRISGKKFEKIWEKISPLFLTDEKNEGNLTIADLELQRRKHSDYIEKQRQAGIASGKSRRSTMVQPTFNDGSTNTQPNPYSLNPIIQNAGQNTHNTQPSALALQSADGNASASENGVCVSGSQISRFSYDERFEYVIACQENGQDIKNPTGLAIKLENGQSDGIIQQFYDSGKKLPKARTPNEVMKDNLRKKYAQEEDTSNH